MILKRISQPFVTEYNNKLYTKISLQLGSIYSLTSDVSVDAILYQKKNLANKFSKSKVFINHCKFYIYVIKQ